MQNKKFWLKVMMTLYSHHCSWKFGEFFVCKEWAKQWFLVWVMLFLQVLHFIISPYPMYLARLQLRLYTLFDFCN
jgi:hypothetical protein